MREERYSLLLVVRLNIEIDLENNFPCAVPLWRSICSSGFDNSADVPADSDQRISVICKRR